MPHTNYPREIETVADEETQDQSTDVQVESPPEAAEGRGQIGGYFNPFVAPGPPPQLRPDVEEAISTAIRVLTNIINDPEDAFSTADQIAAATALAPLVAHGAYTYAHVDPEPGEDAGAVTG